MFTVYCAYRALCLSARFSEPPGPLVHWNDHDYGVFSVQEIPVFNADPVTLGVTWLRLAAAYGGGHS